MYYQDYVVNERKSLRRDKEGRPHLDKVARLDDFFAGCRASEINADLIRKFIEDQRAKGLSNGSINRSLSALKHMFRLAKQDEKLQHVPHFPMTPEADPRPGYLEREQYDKLFAELPAYLRLPLALGYYSGMRLGEVLGLQWLRKDEKGVPREQVDFLHGVIHLEAFETKSNEARDIPIVSQLRTLLLEQREKNRKAHCPYVCFRLDPRGDAVKIVGFRRAWQSACIRAGLGSMVPEVDSETGEVLYAK
ncbi:MAG: site-specific integrase [Candidatus Sulfotelmatobacter sp.]